MSITLKSTISETHSLYMECLNNNNFIDFSKSNNIKELLMKLSNTSYKNLLKVPIETYEDLSTLLDEYFKEIYLYFKQSVNEKDAVEGSQENEIIALLKYIEMEYQINSFIYLLTSNKNIPTNEFGFFETLNSFLFIKELRQIFDLKSPFNNFLLEILEKNEVFGIEFGKDFREKSNLQKLSLILHKLNLEKLFQSTEVTLLKDILKTEGDRIILETLFSDKSLFKNERIQGENSILYFFPKCSNFSDFQKQQLCNLEGPDISSIKQILSFSTTRDDLVRNISQALYCTSSSYLISDFDDLIKRFDDIESNLYEETFSEFGETSCIYAYIKTREKEIKNIKYISSCVEAGRGNTARKIFE